MGDSETLFGAVVDPVAETGGGSDPGTPDFEAIKKKVFGGRGKPSRVKKQTAPSDITAAELEKIFAGENWEEVAGLYFNARFAITGYDGFLLTNGQKKTLGLSLGTTMKMLLKIDPGYVAMVVFLANFGGLIAQKEITYSHIMKVRKERDGKTAS